MKLRTAAILAIVTLAASVARAELMASFSLDDCAGTAAIVARGKLSADGTLAIADVYYGDIDRNQPALISLSGDTFQRLTRSINADGPPEAIVFLRRESDARLQPVLGEAGVVGLHGDGVYAIGAERDTRGERSRTFSRVKNQTRAEFEKSLRDVLAIRTTIETAIAKPRGADRATVLVDLLLKHGRATGTADGLAFATSLISRAFQPIAPAEQGVVLQRINEVTAPVEKAKLVELAGSVPFDRTAFNPLAALADRSQPAIVRRAAMRTLTAIDPFPASEYLAAPLTADEPDLAAVLQALPSASCLSRDRRMDSTLPQDGTYRAGLLSIKVVDALARITRELPPDRIDKDANLGYTFAAVLQNHMHPRLFGPLYDMAWDANSPAREQALSNVRAVTGLQWSRDQRAGWAAWWDKSRLLIEAQYDLTTAAGRARWCQVYSGSDPATRAILLRLWHFEKTIDEPELLKLALGKTDPDAAIAALVELWRTCRLSPESQRTLFEAFYKIEFVESTADPADAKYRTVYIYGTPQIAFPRGLEMDAICSIALNAEPKPPEPSVAGDVTDGVRRFQLGSLSTQLAGEPVAKGVIVLRRIDYYHGKRELWSLRRNLGPMKLRKAE